MRDFAGKFEDVHCEMRNLLASKIPRSSLLSSAKLTKQPFESNRLTLSLDLTFLVGNHQTGQKKMPSDAIRCNQDIEKYIYISW